MEYRYMGMVSYLCEVEWTESDNKATYKGTDPAATEVKY